ncbi:MAG: hypothetical protein IJU18_05780 [Oscillospiraceae bacterium]|nr:hypothetical protein [Oscillospiraceae bacterium]
MFIIILVIASGMIIGACVLLYRWRSSLFEPTTGFLRNYRRIPDGEKARIRTVDGMIFVVSRAHHKPIVYYEYVFTVGGETYGKSFHHDEYELDSPLLPRLKMHYCRIDPRRLYVDGTLRDGYGIAAALGFLGLLFMVVNLVALLS